MKVVIHRGFGSFWLPKDYREKLQIENFWEETTRINPVLVDTLEKDQDTRKAFGLVIVEVPESATDWTIIEYDGNEYIIYVKDGRMYSVCS